MAQTEILDSQLSLSPKTRRRDLLPTWIKIFLWIFMLLGITAPIALVLGIMGFNFNLALLGLETTNSLSITGLILIIIFGIKGAVSIGLWTEKDWAIKLSIIDAIISIIVCIVVMVLPYLFQSNGFDLNLRLELIVIGPYFFKMKEIQIDWENWKS